MHSNQETRYESVQLQQKVFQQANIPYVINKNGAHGSSMLVESRTKQDMSVA
ncbi:MAG: hypothetical protein Alis2KO_04310 [Aliiglaciecola sp.]